VCVIQYR